MSLSLVKRSTNGAPISATQNDANMTAIESAVNTNTTDISARVTTTALNAMFASQSGGKQQVDWANVTGKPGVTSQRYPFKAIQNSSQTATSSGAVNLALGNEVFDPGAAFASGTFTAPVTGYYQFNYSIQISLSSGSPTSISIVCHLNQNGSSVDDIELDFTNSSTGNRIYKSGALLSLTAGNTVTLSVDFSFSGTGTWAISNDANSSLSGFLVQ